MKANVYHNNHKIKVYVPQGKIIRKNKKKVVVVTCSILVTVCCIKILLKATSLRPQKANNTKKNQNKNSKTRD